MSNNKYYYYKTIVKLFGGSSLVEKDEGYQDFLYKSSYPEHEDEIDDSILIDLTIILSYFNNRNDNFDKRLNNQLAINSSKKILLFNQPQTIEEENEIIANPGLKYNTPERNSFFKAISIPYQVQRVLACLRLLQYIYNSIIDPEDDKNKFILENSLKLLDPEIKSTDILITEFNDQKQQIINKIKISIDEELFNDVECIDQAREIIRDIVDLEDLGSKSLEWFESELKGLYIIIKNKSIVTSLTNKYRILSSSKNFKEFEFMLVVSADRISILHLILLLITPQYSNKVKLKAVINIEDRNIVEKLKSDVFSEFL